MKKLTIALVAAVMSVAFAGAYAAAAGDDMKKDAKKAEAPKSDTAKDKMDMKDKKKAEKK